MRNRSWIEPEIYPIEPEFQDALGDFSLLAQRLYQLGIQEVDSAQAFLDADHYTPSSSLELPDVNKAVDIIITAIQQKRKISIWGDFDVDGQTATTLLVTTLRELGGHVDYHIPVRASESHGINLLYLDQLISQGTQVLVSCDTGVTANAEVDYANGKGIPVIITDHHNLPEILPDALAVINPKRLPAGHPLSNLPGVGVAYKLIEQICNYYERQELANSVLDLVALGIVADLAIVKKDTRYLLQKGLKALQKSKRIGLNLLYEETEINAENITEEHISFYIAPRLNALGRLADANLAVEFLSTNDVGKARLLAVEIEGLNAQRKIMTDQVYQAAQKQIENNPQILDQGLILLQNPTWPAGVIGIVASRLVEQYNLPTILFNTRSGELARGSARSIEGVDIIKTISDQCHLLETFGGHPMAAGLSIQPEHIPELYRRLSKAIQQSAEAEKVSDNLRIDGYFLLKDLSLGLVSQIERLSPFGPGNPAPVLATRNLELSGYTSVGRNAEHLLLTVVDETGVDRKVIWWQGGESPIPQGRFDLAYNVRATTYRGQRDVQVEWVDHRLVDQPPIQIASQQIKFQVVDFRHELDPGSLIKSLVAKGDLQVWSEVVVEPSFVSQNRYRLSENYKKLAIWTIPPGLSELRDVVLRTSPEEIYIFGINPAMDHPEDFLKRLLGLVKYSINKQQGEIKLSELAAATAHRTITIHRGIQWLKSHGHVSIIAHDGDRLTVASGSTTNKETTRQTTINLKLLLDETAAFRSFFLRANLEVLITL